MAWEFIVFFWSLPQNYPGESLVVVAVVLSPAGHAHVGAPVHARGGKNLGGGDGRQLREQLLTHVCFKTSGCVCDKAEIL